jgi:calmodulin
MLRARKVFDSYDTQGLGRLDRGSVKLAWMALLGHKPSRCELADMLEQERGRVGGDVRDGDDEDSGIQHVGWAKFVQAAARRRGGTDGTNEVRQAFKAFDRRCLGFLTLADVKDTFREVAPHVPERTVEAIFFEFDDDHDGRVNFAQFERLWLRGL